jgi:hypothetical protein
MKKQDLSKEVIFHESKEKNRLVDTGNRYMQDEEEALNSGEVTRGDALDSNQKEIKQSNKSNTQKR